MTIIALLDSTSRLTDAVYRGTAPSSGGSTGSVSASEPGTSGEVFSAGAVLYRNATDGFWYNAKADAEATSGPVEIGVPLTPALGAGVVVTIFRRGLLSLAGWGLTPGLVYVSETVAGGTQAVATVVLGHVGRVVGWARTATSMYVDPSPDWTVQ